jgi:hypothetical protein
MPGLFQLIANGNSDIYKYRSYGVRKPSLSARRKAKETYSTKKIMNHFWIFQGKLYKTREKLMIAIIDELEYLNPIRTDMQSLNIVINNMSEEQKMVMQVIKLSDILPSIPTVNMYEFNFDIKYVRFKKIPKDIHNGILLSKLIQHVGKHNLTISTSNIKEIIETEHRIEDISVLL